LFEKYPNLKGTFSALFCDSSKKIEVYFKERNESFLSEIKKLGFTPIETTISSHGFIFPRTIVQIINEAYFALEENVASKEDVNRAMKFGVNYPKGPFEWSQGKEKVAVLLLDELFHKTGDRRYICSAYLRNEALN
jgi:3-hydroxybutyryl-CoA dehydrogenase